MVISGATLNDTRSHRCAKFHYHWCNSRGVPKSYVNGGLQRPLNVLLSGPFKKSFQASHGRVLSTPQFDDFRADLRQPSTWSVVVGRKATRFAPTENRSLNH